MVPGVPSDASVMKRDSAGAPICENCKSDDRWILHNVHRNKISRLCTSCVFKLHTIDFCTICFSLHGPDKPTSTALVCIKCKSTAHPDCLAPLNIPKSPYLCPICLNPNSKLFDFRKPNSNKAVAAQNQVIDLRSAKALRVAAIIAANSLREAANKAWVEAEKKAKAAVDARKKSKVALGEVAKLWSDIDGGGVSHLNGFKMKSFASTQVVEKKESFNNGGLVERKDGIVVNKVINGLPSGSSQHLQKNK